jgi:hypothetical protein
MYSQKSTLDEIAKKTCEYLETDEVSKLNSEDKVLKLGVYIIGLYSEYKDQLKEEGVDIDFSSSNGGRDFGEIVGMSMVSFCPETLIALASDVEDAEEETSESTNSFTGKLKSIKGSEFNFIVVEGTDGTTQKFLWFSNFVGSNLLISNDSMIGSKVKVTFKNTECFSPQLGEYIIRKEIVEISYL